MADKLTAYRVRNGKRVATYRIAVVYERDAAKVYPPPEQTRRPAGARPGMTARLVDEWQVEGS